MTDRARRILPLLLSAALLIGGSVSYIGWRSWRKQRKAQEDSAVNTFRCAVLQIWVDTTAAREDVLLLSARTLCETVRQSLLCVPIETASVSRDGIPLLTLGQSELAVSDAGEALSGEISLSHRICFRIAEQFSLPEGEITLSVLIRTDLPDRTSTALRLFLLGGGITVILALCAVLYLRKTEAIITAVGETAERISDGDLTARMPDGKGTAAAFNRMAESVQTRTERLEAIAQGRKRFADNFAHEMKTPLTSILCSADLLRIKRDVGEDERREYAGIIVEEATRMRNLSQKILMMATADNAELETETVSIASLGEEIRASANSVLLSRGINLEIRLPEAYIRVDRALFQSLLYNLIDNAAKASEQGQTVQVTGTVKKEILRIAVTDHGIGMNEEEIRHITEPFYMADKSRSRKAGGVGLGLTLCMEIARRHNAALSVRSQPGQGTTVLVRIRTVRRANA